MWEEIEGEKGGFVCVRACELGDPRGRRPLRLEERRRGWYYREKATSKKAKEQQYGRSNERTDAQVTKHTKEKRN